MGKRKYNTEEERKEAQRERNRKWYQNNKEKVLSQHAEWREKNPEYNKNWKEKHKDEMVEYNSNYYKSHKNEMSEWSTEYHSTQKGRAVNLASNYRYVDKKYNREECTLTPEWIVEHIFNQPCHYCGESDWTKIGCDRLDNTKAHTPDNVVPCCLECNLKRNHKTYDEFMRLIKKVG